jgi:hypothetical protein
VSGYGTLRLAGYSQLTCGATFAPQVNHANALYQFATKRLHIGMKAAGTDTRKFLKMLGFPVFSKTLAYSVQCQLNAIWY